MMHSTQAAETTINESPTILVIEDQTHVRKVIERMFATCGVQVISAHNGSEGATAYLEAEGSIELVLCDFSMPGINGLETADRIYDVDPLATVVIMSGFATEDLRRGHPRLSAFLQKPLRLETVKRMADVVISSS